MTPLSARAERYDREHARGLRALAYRMLGSRAEAEDIVQEAWLRWAQVDESTVEHAGAYLSRLVTNLCMDKLGSAAARREQYVGVWLPEPLLDEEAGWSPGPEAQAEFAQDVSVAFMLALERLSPLERAAFLLHEVFDLDFDEIGRRLDRSAAACRQLASRARIHVREARPRFLVDKERGLELAQAFFAASRGGDMKMLAGMLSADVSVHADGGGKRSAALAPVVGFDAVMKTHERLAAHFQKNGSELVRMGFINGLPGFITLEADGELQTTALEIEDGRIAAIYIVRNPDKLRHLH